ICVCAGLASNLAAMRALATEGIQRGHMSLHARQIALAAGAQGSEVDIIAARMVQERQIKPARAEALLAELRSSETGQAPSATVETASAFGG
ncbi:MAG: 3-hydroxy-3-methylglutaryl-CoA reductase, partial [Roseiflexus sp.]|nr:3-hydroxy-3-methylglutaryl-CoA reductase [Roseiflexus sp.]